MFTTLMRAGCDPCHDFGHICLSQKHSNSVRSNVTGAAAYWGHVEIMELAVKNLHGFDIEK